MFCVNCGGEASSKMKFCGYCGKLIRAKSPPNVEIPGAPPMQKGTHMPTQMQQPHQSVNRNHTPQRPIKKILTIAIPIVVIVITLVIWLLYSKSYLPPTDSTPPGSGIANNQGSDMENLGGESNSNIGDSNDNIIPIIPDLPAIEENPVSDFEYRAIAGGIEITKYVGTPVRVRIPDTIEGVSVISIGDRAFLQSGIMEIHIPDSVTSIGQSAFSGNVGLTSVSMGNNVRNSIHFGGLFWRVLDEQNGRALIISEDILEKRAYHADGNEVTWETSQIRQYLNNELFYHFTSVEQARILEITIINHDRHGSFGGNDTIDKIFLLSVDEARFYFADFADISSKIFLDTNGEEVRHWWLRSPGASYNWDAAYVANNVSGGIASWPVTEILGIRPAMWITLSP